KQFFNRPLVLLSLFLLTLGVIVYAFLPTSPEKIFRRAEAKMRSDEPSDWEEAIEDLETLQREHPGFREEEVEAFHKKAKGAREGRREARNARLAGSMSEAHWFFEKGLRLRQQGKQEEARAVWNDLVRAFQDVPAEGPWVERARTELERDKGEERTGTERWESV